MILILLLLLLFIKVSSISFTKNNNNNNNNQNYNNDNNSKCSNHTLIISSRGSNYMLNNRTSLQSYITIPIRYVYDKITKIFTRNKNSINSTYSNRHKNFLTNFLFNRSCNYNNSNSNDIHLEDNILYYGNVLSITDIEGLKQLKQLRNEMNTINKDLKWLNSAKDMELLRFLKAKNGNVKDAWMMIIKHAKWRISRNGPDNTKQTFHPELHKQVFWLGLSKENKPILVIRTHYHDGYYYNEDPKIFTAFIVHIIEQGRKLYGIGQLKRARLILDRISLPGKRTKPANLKKFSDVEIMKNLIEVYKSIYDTVMNNYPDVLELAQIVPASLIFSAFYKVVGRIMDENTRNKFVLINSKDIPKFVSQYDRRQLPITLGGLSDDYIPTVPSKWFQK